MTTLGWVAGLLALLLAACANDEQQQQAQPPAEPDYVMLTEDGPEDQIHGEAGAYALTARAEFASPLAVIEVPVGWASFGWFALWPLDHDRDPSQRGLQYWGVHAVYAHPCRSLDGATPPGDSVADLADALASQDLTSATKPTPVVIDGHQGLYLELTMPTDVDFDECQEGYFTLWQGSAGDKHHFVQSRGLVERIWILDVDGDRVLVDAVAAPDASPDVVDELAAMVESTRFVEP